MERFECWLYFHILFSIHSFNSSFLFRFQKVFEEAELCLADLRETLFEVDDEQYREECACAEGSLDNAFTAYIDLLEDFRRSSEEQLQFYSEERNSHANDLKRLRKELDQIIEVAKNREKSMN